MSDVELELLRLAASTGNLVVAEEAIRALTNIRALRKPKQMSAKALVEAIDAKKESEAKFQYDREQAKLKEREALSDVRNGLTGPTSLFIGRPF